MVIVLKAYTKWRNVFSRKSNFGKNSNCRWHLIHKLEKEMETHSSIFAWRIPWTGEPGGLQFMGSQRIRHDWSTDTFIHFTFLSILPGKQTLICSGTFLYGYERECFKGQSCQLLNSSNEPNKSMLSIEGQENV